MTSQQQPAVRAVDVEAILRSREQWLGDRHRSNTEAYELIAYDLLALAQALAAAEAQIDQWKQRAAEEARRNLRNGELREAAEAQRARLEQQYELLLGTFQGYVEMRHGVRMSLHELKLELGLAPPSAAPSGEEG
jgi:uncharacterized protein (DUF3084 family)